MKKLLLLFLILTPILSFSKNPTEDKNMISIVPLPEKIVLSEGNFILNAGTKFTAGSTNIFDGVIKYFNDFISPSSGFRLSTAEKTDEENYIGFKLNQNLAEEAYILEITKKNIIIEASSQAGAFYAVQSLLQLMPPQVFSGSMQNYEITIRCLRIEDKPRYKWRGMHLDVSRHFFPVEFVKKYIDYIAMYKLNRFHWHLVDDQGWRIEIKKYPELTKKGAWRVDRSGITWRQRERQKEGEVPSYGGFYTQEEIKEVVQYAKDRNIEVLPEIEMPAHVLSALTAYPEVSCTGGPFTVPPGTYWPNIDIYCAGKEKTFDFLQDILLEVMDLFPYEYIHIGGDEADKTEWKKCPDCQRRIKEEGLKDEAELQSYFIKRIEKFLISKNKRLIGWDEILEGGLAPEATVMSWRGMQGGIDAAKQGHDVIMTPTTYCYFDYYQGNPEFEPEAIGGYLPLKNVYKFEPTPDELNSEEAKFILGGQANLWTEFVPTTSHAEYMLFPRVAALAEAVWTQKELRNWDDFARRINRQFENYDYKGINYAKSVYTVTISPKQDLTNSSLSVLLETESIKPEIYYTIDGSEPGINSLKYSSPVPVDKTFSIKAASFLDGKIISGVSIQKFIKHAALLKKVDFKNQYSINFAAGGDFGLTNGLKGTVNYRDGQWMGFSGKDLEAVVDLGEIKKISRINTGSLQKESSWIFLPKTVEYYVSTDGVDFTKIGEITNDVPDTEKELILKDFSTEFNPVDARYVKVIAQSLKVCPDWHTGAGKSCWLFVDEIIVE